MQETYNDEKLKAVWEAEWGGKIFCSHGTKHSKGVMILLNPKYDTEVEKLKRDNHGRLIILDPKMNDTNLVLINLYAPMICHNRFNSLIGLRTNSQNTRTRTL